MSKSIAASGSSFDGAIGDVIASMLTEAQFQSQRSTNWILMDGRNVAGSLYANVTGNSVIPDARGAFLRGKNNGRSDGSENPGGDLAMGTFQSDAFGSHAHTISGGGSSTLTIRQQNTGVSSVTVPADTFDLGLNGVPYGEGQTYGGAATPTNQASVTLATSSVTVNANGGNETRPKNITINYFIKIN
jgi:hypothetical protein